MRHRTILPNRAAGKENVSAASSQPAYRPPVVEVAILLGRLVVLSCEGGASWYEREQRGLGVPLVAVAERFERLEQAQSADHDSFSGHGVQSGVPTAPDDDAI
jgi:hypothetical protein